MFYNRIYLFERAHFYTLLRNLPVFLYTFRFFCSFTVVILVLVGYVQTLFIWSFKRIILVFSFAFQPCQCRIRGDILCVFCTGSLARFSPCHFGPYVMMRFYSCKHNKIIANLPLDCDAYTMYYILMSASTRAIITKNGK